MSTLSQYLPLDIVIYLTRTLIVIETSLIIKSSKNPFLKPTRTEYEDIESCSMKRRKPLVNFNLGLTGIPLITSQACQPLSHTAPSKSISWSERNRNARKADYIFKI